MTDPHAIYDNPLVTRYASRTMAERWSSQRRIQTWRQLWFALAETQAELELTSEDGVTPRISSSQLAELQAHLKDIDFAQAAEYERRLRHDVMAHIHTFAQMAPEAGDILHLGATSCYVTDNADLILLKESLEDLASQLASLIDHLARFAENWKEEPTLGYTHFQPAQLTTVGKRACLWIYELVLDLAELEHRIADLPFRGAKGTTGTQASFLALFRGDHRKVRQLDARLAEKFGFRQLVPVCGQTYSRKLDSQVVASLAGLGESLHKWGNDLRLLGHLQEIDEPTEADQVGSSAMPYKRNPMRAERMCSLSRLLMGQPAMLAQTSASQWLERTLDDSAIRRVILPQACLAADAVLRLGLNLAAGMVVHREVVARNVRLQLPYMATENLLMAAVARGGDRQKVHELIRSHAHAVTLKMKNGQGSPEELIERLRVEPAFLGIDLDRFLEPAQFIGRAAEQVDEFLAEVIAPIRSRYVGRLGAHAELRV